MTIKRLDQVSVVDDDLAAAIDFFTALGMTLEGGAPIEGPWVDRANGIAGVRVVTHLNALGLRSVMFAVGEGIHGD